MSMTNLQVIESALQKAGIIAQGKDEGESANIDQANDGLTHLNQMMAEWSAADINESIDFPPQDTLSATCPIPAWAELAVITNLAVGISEEMGVPLRPNLAAMAEKHKSKYLQVFINANTEGADMSRMPVGTGSGRWNIYTDSF